MILCLSALYLGPDTMHIISWPGPIYENSEQKAEKNKITGKSNRVATEQQQRLQGVYDTV